MASESIMVCSSDITKLFFQIILVRDGVGIYGDVKEIGPYPEGCDNVTGVCCKNGNLYMACNIGICQLKIDGGGPAQVILQNGTLSLITAHGIAPFQEGLLFPDPGSHQIKLLMEGQISIIAGSGEEENADGSPRHSSFCQPMGITVEYDKNIYVTDPHAGTLKLMTDITKELLNS